MAKYPGLDEEDWEGNDISDKEMEEIVVEEAMEEETAGDSVKEGPEASSIWDGPEFPKELARFPPGSVHSAPPPALCYLILAGTVPYPPFPLPGPSP